MSEHDELNSKHQSRTCKITELTVWSNQNASLEDVRQFARTYQRAMQTIVKVIRRDIAGPFDKPENHPDVAALFYKGALRELVRFAVNSIGEQKARSMLRQISDEVKTN